MLSTEAFHKKNYAFKKLSKTQNQKNLDCLWTFELVIQAEKCGTITTTQVIQPD